MRKYKELLKEARDLFLLCTLLDKSSQCQDMVDKIDTVLEKDDSKTVLVIYKQDLNSTESDIIGVASSREKAKELIIGYFGTEDIEYTDFEDVRDSGIDFTWTIYEEGKYGEYEYNITVFDFNIDML